MPMQRLGRTDSPEGVQVHAVGSWDLTAVTHGARSSVPGFSALSAITKLEPLA